MIYVELLAGLILLVVGGDSLVRGAVAVARRMGVSPLLIGLTLVGFGTSTPEMLTSVQAAFAGSPGIALGNVVGSNIANILLILGTAALIHPMRASREALFRDGTVMLLAAGVCVVIVLIGALDRMTGAALVVLLSAYVLFTYLRERTSHDASAAMHEAEASAAEPSPKRLWVAFALLVGGLFGILIGADFLVDAGIALASAAGVSETLVGLTIVAVGTSLPELVTSVMAAIRRQPDVAFGNVVGSNIYNVFAILGVTAIVQPIAVPPELAGVDIWVMLAATVLLLIFSLTGRSLARLEGLVLVASYAAYITYLVGDALRP